VCISPLSLLIIFIFFVVEWKVHQDYMTLTTILFLPSNLTNTTTPFKRTNKENNNSTESFRCRFPIHGPDSDLRSRVTVPSDGTDSDYGGPIPTSDSDIDSGTTAPNHSRLPITISAPIRFAISDSDSRSRVTVPILIPIRPGPIDLSIRVSLSKQSINTYQSSAPKHRLVFLTKHDL